MLLKSFSVRVFGSQNNSEMSWGMIYYNTYTANFDKLLILNSRYNECLRFNELNYNHSRKKDTTNEINYDCNNFLQKPSYRFEHVIKKLDKINKSYHYFISVSYGSENSI